MTKDRRGCPLLIKGVTPDEGIVDAVVSVFNNVDVVGDRILPGAFAKSIERKAPKIVWMHDWGAPVGKTIEAKELQPGDAGLPEQIRTLGGLRLKMQFNLETQRGREAFSDIKAGIIDEFSIGFSINEEQNNGGIREIVEATLYEASPVLYGANPETRLISAKSGLNDHIEAIGDEVLRMVDRVKERAAIREKEGRTLSSKNVDTLRGVADALQSASETIGNLLDNAGPKPKDTEKAMIEREMLRESLRIQGIIQ